MSVTSCEFAEKRATKPKLLAQSRPVLYVSQQRDTTLHDKLITQGEVRETSTQNLQGNNVAQQVEGFCISYFAILSSEGVHGEILVSLCSRGLR